MSQNSSRVSDVNSNRRKLEYRALLEDVLALDVTAIDSTIKETKVIVSKTQKIITDEDIEERTNHPSEGVLGSHVILATSQVITQCTKNISGNTNTYDANKFAELLKNNSFYLRKICIPYQIPPYTYTHGAFLPSPTVPKQRVRKTFEKQKFRQQTQPENVINLEKNEETSEMVVKVNKLLNKAYKNNKYKPICFFRFVIHPSDFAQTVENIYHVSFLVRDGFAAITIDESSQLPYISPVAKETREQTNNENMQTKQFIVSLDKQEWRDAVEAFNIKEPFLVIK